MMSFLRRRGKSELDNRSEVGADGLYADLATLYEVPAPDAPFDFKRARSLAGRPRPASPWRRLWKPAVGLAAAAIVAAIVAVTTLPGGGAQQVNAEQIFSRTQDVTSGTPAANTTSYHLVATAGNGAKVSNIETWFQDASHFRTVQTTGPESFSAIVNGDDVWLVQTDDGHVTAVHATGQDAVGAATSQLVQGAISSSSSPETTLAGVLSEYSNGNCESVSQHGTQSVVGREAYIIVVTPQPQSCSDPRAGEKLSAAQAAGDPLNSMTVLIDEQTFQTLRAEQRDASGATVFGYEVTQMDVGQSIPGSTFEYQPPAGVTAVNATSPSEIKQAFGSTAQGEPPALKK